MRLDAVLITFLLGLPAWAQGQPERDLLSRFAEAIRTGDVKTLDRVLAPEYFEISPAGEYDPRAKVLTFYQPPQFNSAQAPKVIEIDEWQAMPLNADVSVISTRETSVITTPDGERRIPIRVTTVLRRGAAGWLIVSRHYTGIRPPRK